MEHLSLEKIQNLKPYDIICITNIKADGTPYKNCAEKRPHIILETQFNYNFIVAKELRKLETNVHICYFTKEYGLKWVAYPYKFSYDKIEETHNE